MSGHILESLYYAPTESDAMALAKPPKSRAGWVGARWGRGGQNSLCSSLHVSHIATGTYVGLVRVREEAHRSRVIP